MIDLDGMLPGTAIQTVVLHWYQPNMVFNCTQKGHRDLLRPGINCTASHIAPYIPPQPPPCSHHRYVYLLFAQSPSYRFPECFSHIPPKTVDARAGFDMRQFMQVAALDPPIAVNYFVARNNATDDDRSPSPSATTTSFRSVTCHTGPTGS